LPRDAPTFPEGLPPINPVFAAAAYGRTKRRRSALLHRERVAPGSPAPPAKQNRRYSLASPQRRRRACARSRAGTPAGGFAVAFSMPAQTRRREEAARSSAFHVASPECASGAAGGGSVWQARSSGVGVNTEPQTTNPNQVLAPEEQQHHHESRRR